MSFTCNTRLHLRSRGIFVFVGIMLIVALFIHLVNVLLQNRFTCYHLVRKFFIRSVLHVQASRVVHAELADLITNALTAVFAPLDFITNSMVGMAHVFCVLQVTYSTI